MLHRLVALLVAASAAGCTGSPLPSLDQDMGVAVPDLAPDLCHNFMLDGQETATDCGGPTCMPCDTGDACKKGRDCASGFCTNSKCDAPSCTDGAKNGTESDKDCGGTCPGCDLGGTCNVGSDCLSKTCTNGVCVMGPCMNGKQDGSETDKDCGGPDCMPCGDGQMCNVGTDCTGMICTNNVCHGALMCAKPMASCDGNDANGCETNTDTDPKNCGHCGNICPKGQACAAGKCTNLPPSCQIVAGIRWCYNPNACGENCTEVCKALGLPLTIDDATWLNAQNTLQGCQAIATAFGLDPNQVIVQSFSYACIEDGGGSPSKHMTPGPPIDRLQCSTAPNCPSNLKRSQDQAGIPCNAMGWTTKAICPCQ